MDRISYLPEALLLKILSELPTAKDVVVTMVLSKRWLPLWKSVPKLVYDDSYPNIEYGKFSRFVDRSLILHEAPVQTLHFKLVQSSVAADIGIWIAIADKRGVRDLSIDIDCYPSAAPVILPRSLYTGCRMLVTLVLKSVTLMDASSLPSFPTLKTLELLSVKYPGDGFVTTLLSNCYVLQDLVVERCLHDNVTVFSIIVPSVKSVSLYEGFGEAKGDAHGFVMDTPLLEMLDIVDYIGGFLVIKNNMPKIVKAYVDVTYSHPREILGYITSAKHLFLCLSTSKVYPVGSIFHRLVNLTVCTCETEWLNLLMLLLRDSPTLQVLKLEREAYHEGMKYSQLVRLELCTCQTEWLNLLMRLLKDSPKLRFLKLEQFHEIRTGVLRCWSEPSYVPECLSSSLETFEWIQYEGREEEKQVARFILRSSSSLKTATFYHKLTDPEEKLGMFMELPMLGVQPVSLHSKRFMVKFQGIGNIWLLAVRSKL